VIADLERRAVLHAVAEAARSGPEAFLRRYGFRPGTRDVLDVGGLQLPPKAVVAVATAYQNGGEPLRPCQLSGGLEHAARVLVRLGFTVRRDQARLTLDDVAIPQRLSKRPAVAELRLYVCRPTNARSVAACYEHGFGSLVSPMTVDKTRGDLRLTDLSGHAHPLAQLPYVVDNGAWPCHVAGAQWSGTPFLRLLRRLEQLGPKPEFVIAPDIVGAGSNSLAFSLDWLARHRDEFAAHRWMLAVQDGMQVERVRIDST